MQNGSGHQSLDKKWATAPKTYFGGRKVNEEYKGYRNNCEIARQMSGLSPKDGKTESPETFGFSIPTLPTFRLRTPDSFHVNNPLTQYFFYQTVTSATFGI